VSCADSHACLMFSSSGGWCDAHLQVMQWIADCETPVVYISFGTVVDLHAAQVCARPMHSGCQGATLPTK
jgi:hypothetical protein